MSSETKSRNRESTRDNEELRADLIDGDNTFESHSRCNSATNGTPSPRHDRQCSYDHIVEDNSKHRERKRRSPIAADRQKMSR